LRDRLAALPRWRGTGATGSGPRIFGEPSAVLAILARGPEAGRFLDAIAPAGRRETGAHVRLEATIDLARIPGLSIPDALRCSTTGADLRQRSKDSQ
jgi:uncharacterized protein with PIN domain